MKITITMVNYLVPILLFSIIYVRSESDPCDFGTCGECIREPEACVWCSEVEFDDRRCRPLSYTNINKSWCKNDTVNPKQIAHVELNKNFSETKNEEIQFRPQLIKMKARPGHEFNFTMSFKPAKHYPLDVYYLMDISDTMRNKTQDLKDQAKKIYEELTNYTNNVRLGIGSFVEKPAFPFCDPNIHTSHAFKHEVTLTDDMEKFNSKLVEISKRFGSNFDDPEAGLDALMQAMKCENEVGWRNGARRIIVLCTDSTYHSAGDGKIVGAVKPNDMKCHLKDNVYYEALTYDYPSVSQINQAARDGNFMLIFAITSNTQTKETPETEYQELVKRISGAKYAKLEGGESVIKIIKEAYEELSNKVELEVKQDSDFIEVTIDQNCNSDPKINCESPHKKIVSIPGNLKVKSCPNDDKNFVYNVTINPRGLSDNLTIQLELVCKCDCEKTKGVAADKCHKAGFLQCGICKCDEGRYGTNCQCDGSSTDQTDMAKCKLNSTDSNLCSGKGKCRCGKCESCIPPFSGDFCQFDDTSCPRPNNKLCSEHGTCRRGQCHCIAQWSGLDCGCPIDDRSCFAPYSKKVCSGNGKCVCGMCQCDAVPGKNETFSGAFCDSCEECAEKRCKELEDYAYCNYMHMNNKAFCDNGTTSEIDVLFANKTEINGPRLYMAKFCKKELDSNNGTYMVFKYQYEKNKLKMTIQKELEIPPEADILIAAASAVGLVLLIGILTVIIWKVLVDIHDKKEYQKFSAEAKAQGYDVSENPLYQDPSINFSNPVYNNQVN